MPTPVAPAGTGSNGGLSVHPETGEIWATESSFIANSATIFNVDPVTGVASNLTRLGLNGLPTEFGLDGFEILPDGRFVGTRGGHGTGGVTELYEINPIPDPGSGLAELTFIPLTLIGPVEGKINGLESGQF